MKDKPTATDLFALTVESSGRIIGVIHEEINPFQIALNKGSKVDEILPFLFGYFPMAKSEVLPQNISFNHFFGNVLLYHSANEVKVEFYNNPEGLELWEHLMQKHNQEQLIKSIVMKTDSSALSCNVLYSLGFMTFQQSEKGFELIGNVPDWFKKLIPDYNYSSSCFHLEELFPFLEVFLPEASELYHSKEDGKAVSGLWTEFSPQSEEVILQATAIRENGYNFIFLESVSERNPEKQKNLQKLREQSLAYRQLAKTEEKLRNVLKNREQFISIFSHDFRGPLAGIYSLIDLLRNDDEFMSNFKTNHSHLFNVIYKDVRDLHDYGSKLYDWSNVNFGSMKLERVFVDFNAMVHNLITTLEEKIFSKKTQIKLDIPNHFKIFVDEVFFKNALFNILTNAIKFSYPMGNIFISAKETKDFQIITISDEGMGMSQEIIDSIFNINIRKSSMGTSGEKGTGIGLTIVKKIMDMHQVEVLINSTEKKGTTIELKLAKK